MAIFSAACSCRFCSLHSSVPQQTDIAEYENLDQRAKEQSFPRTPMPKNDSLDWEHNATK